MRTRRGGGMRPVSAGGVLDVVDRDEERRRCTLSYISRLPAGRKDRCLSVIFGLGQFSFAAKTNASG